MKQMLETLVRQNIIRQLISAGSTEEEAHQIADEKTEEGVEVLEAAAKKKNREGGTICKAYDHALTDLIDWIKNDFEVPA